VISGYHINVIYRDSLLARIPMKVVIHTAGWLRSAKNSEDQRLQVDYLKKAIAVNSEDTQVRKMLGGYLLSSG